MFAYARAVQLAFDSADRLVELVEERRGAVAAEEAARVLFALGRVPDGLARSLLAEVVEGDSRLGWRNGAVCLAAGGFDPRPLEEAAFVVVDLETTGLAPGRSRICEIGAVRVERLDAVAFADGATLVAHNARFDVGFLDWELERLTGRRYAGSIVDTVWLARRLLSGRAPRVSLASLSYFFGTAARPCHRALPDAEATAEILLRLIGLAQERGAETVDDLVALAVPRRRAAHAKRTLAFGAPTSPGVYLFHDAHDRVLYVGRARDLRARLRSYFQTSKLRPAVEAALGAVERIEWRVLGSELEAALEELRLLRELRPPANARSTRPDRYVYLGVRADRVVVSSKPTPYGPVKSRRRAELAARALEPPELERPASALPRLRRKRAALAETLRYEDAARLRDRLNAVEGLAAELERLRRLREVELCLLVPAERPGYRRAFFVAAGRIAAVRSVPPGPGAQLELETGIAQARRAEPSLEPEHADELLVAAQFLRRPPPELEVVSFDELECRAA